MQKEPFLQQTYRVIRKEIQAIITVSYLLAVGIGMLFNAHKYSEFGINIFDYADIFFFLIAPFTDLKILLFTLTSVFLTYFVFRLDKFWKQKFPKSYSIGSLGMDKKTWFKYIRMMALIILFPLYMKTAAQVYGSVSKKHILKQPRISLRYVDDEIVKGKFIGKTTEVIFLYDDSKVIAIPMTAIVKEIEIR